MDMMNKKVKVISGKLQGFKGVVLGDCKLTNELLIQIDEFTMVKVNQNDIEESNLKEIHTVHGSKIIFETQGDKILITINLLPFYNKTILTPMFDVNDKEKSLHIAINEYKIEALKIELNKIRLENAKLQGLIIK